MIKTTINDFCKHNDECLQKYYKHMARFIAYGSRNDLLNCPDCKKCTCFENVIRDRRNDYEINNSFTE